MSNRPQPRSRSRSRLHRVVMLIVCALAVIGISSRATALPGVGSTRTGGEGGDLESTLRQYESGWQSNGAMKRLVDDYVQYHQVLAVAGGICVIGLLFVSVTLFRRFRSSPRPASGQWSANKKLSLLVSLMTGTSGALMALIVAANVATAANPMPGFLLASARPSPNGAAVDAEVVSWVASGTSPTPMVVNDLVRDRLSWQAPKAIICGVLLVVFVMLAVRIWKRSTELSRRGQASITSPQRSSGRLMLAEFATVSAALLMMVMTLANTQASIAPLALTVLGGS